MYVSKVVDELPPSGIRAFFDLVLGMKDVISLGVGEPDFVTPWNIREHAIYSLEQGYTSYTSNKGLAELRQDIVKFISKAQLRRYRGATLNDEFNGGLIVYNNVTDVFTLDGAPATGKNSSTGQPGAPAGRVKAMLTPKPDNAPAKAPANAASGALRDTTTLGGSKP